MYSRRPKDITVSAPSCAHTMGVRWAVKKKSETEKSENFSERKSRFKPVYNTKRRLGLVRLWWVFVAWPSTCKRTAESHPQASRCQLWSLCSSVTPQKSFPFSRKSFFLLNHLSIKKSFRWSGCRILINTIRCDFQPMGNFESTRDRD